MRKILIYLILTLVLVNITYALNLNNFETTIFVYDDGIADVNYFVSFNSTDFNDLIYFPAYNPESIIVTDGDRELKFITIGGMISVKPEKRNENYNIKVRYFTNSLTTKNNEKWTIFYEIPPYSSMNFDNVEKATLSFILPKTTTLIESSDNRIIYLKDKVINLKWNINPKTQSSFKVNAIYTINPFHSNIKQYVMISIITILIIILLIIVLFKISNNYIKKISKEKKDIINTLSQKEKEIVELILQNKDKLTQSSIQKLTGINKATLSRTIKLLQRRNILEIRPAGNTNYILLTDWFSKK